MHWLLLVYTVPSQPTRSRALVWREIKRLGAVYLRDDVAVLPDRPFERSTFGILADRVRAIDGQATIVSCAVLEAVAEDLVITRAREARGAEYAAVAGAAARLASHLRQELAHRDLSARELSSITQELQKVAAWCAQVEARDHFEAADARAAARVAIADCTDALDQVTASRQAAMVAR
jgi:hypothetical protein